MVSGFAGSPAEVGDTEVGDSTALNDNKHRGQAHQNAAEGSRQKGPR